MRDGREVVSLLLLALRRKHWLEPGKTCCTSIKLHQPFLKRLLPFLLPFLKGGVCLNCSEKVGREKKQPGEEEEEKQVNNNKLFLLLLLLPGQ